MFHFKQFSLLNESSALKIGTDAVLLGAWANISPGDTVWDIGSGGGVIGLMLLQRGASSLTAVEIDPASAEECRRNIENSPWNSRGRVITGNYLTAISGIEKPSLIVSNPPFYKEDTICNSNRRNTARHEGELSPLSLIEFSKRHLLPSGRLAMIIPTKSLDEIALECEIMKMQITAMLSITTIKGKEPKRLLIEITNSDSTIPISTDSLYICEANGNYTAEFKQLTNDFYLDK